MTPEPLPPDDADRRILDALTRAAVRARRVAAQTGTRLITVQHGRVVAERVPPEEGFPPAPSE